MSYGTTLVGGVAATAYIEPIFTQDMGSIVLVDSDEEYLSVFRRLTEFAEGMEGMHHVLGGVPVQLFPTTTKLLYLDVLQNARLARVGALRVKVASPEHLILMSLEAFRPRDRERIHLLFSVADMDKVDQLFQRFDDEKGTLAERLQSLH